MKYSLSIILPFLNEINSLKKTLSILNKLNLKKNFNNLLSKIDKKKRKKFFIKKNIKILNIINKPNHLLVELLI